MLRTDGQTGGLTKCIPIIPFPLHGINNNDNNNDNNNNYSNTFNSYSNTTAITVAATTATATTTNNNIIFIHLHR